MVWIFTDSSVYTTIERILIGIIAFFILILFFVANKKISQDKNLTLDKMDKIIFFLAFLQIFFLALYFLFYTSTFFLASIRASRLVQEIFLCMLLSYILYEEQFIQELIFKIVTFSVILIGGYWFTIAILLNSSFDYNCRKIYWIIFSILTFGVSFFTILFGSRAIMIIQNFINTTNEEIDRQNDDADGQKKKKGKSLEELKNRKVQLLVIVLTSFVSSSLLLTWDMIAHYEARSPKECSIFFVSHDGFTLILFCILKLPTFFLSAIGIYYTFYWRNKKSLEIESESERSLSVFYDYRNDVTEES